MTTVVIGRGTVRTKAGKRRFKAVLKVMDGVAGLRDRQGTARTREGAIAKALGKYQIEIINRDGDLNLARACASGQEFQFLAAGRELEVL